MKISIIKKENQFNNESDKPEINDNKEFAVIKKEKSSRNILIFKVVVAVLYAFGLGYSLFFFGDNFIKVGVKFLILLIPLYYIIDLPYSIIKSFLLPNVFSKDEIVIALNILTFDSTIITKSSVPKIRYLLSILIPFLLLILVPTILSYFLEFNFYLYLIASATAIISIKDLIYIINILKHNFKGNSIKLDLNNIIIEK
ncbi:hypothetical protein [Clostridium tertium]|uniref:Uncharacterized protein n=1 Tax=Clostridium tertium TaxID=1559 RepID=A0A6N2YJA6_9CLOT